MYKSVVILAIIGQVLTQECGICPPGPCNPDDRCRVAQDPMNPTKLPHADCGKFYKCSGGNACEMSCPAGLHWSKTLNRCEWPHIACCDPNVPCTPCPEQCPTPSPAPTTTTTTTTTTTPSTTPTPTTIATTPDDNVCLPCLPHCTDNARCPLTDDPMNPTLLPHADCTRFYKCSNGQACEMQCRVGEHFSEKLQRCEWPNYACCDPTVPCEPMPDPTDPCWPNPCPVLNCRPDSGCPTTDDPMNPIHIRNPSSCLSFYKCLQGQACLIDCPIGQHWDNFLQRCEWPHIACCDPNVVCCAQCRANRQHELARVFGIKMYN